MGKAGRRRVEKYFNVEKMVDETEKLYFDLMRSKKKELRSNSA
jgi:glycosyltransferase involved in cell wall biosynthesis